ncbi:hypothetical protein AC629_34610 [Bradyrhizobium sp. NAS80.1]|uniref:hypothetical protein n=1 Tax=Bradyrhizobium sp. NAS80.1 TaxID=1680159 RepID=UPI000966D412|nr:hypothetical protein [Bradyrhizobium sp. NAS80.1]OKO74683.1 hypothetical protein AC629_34610 [Bradyrhizobium sp. NAS80.1]
MIKVAKAGGLSAKILPGLTLYGQAGYQFLVSSTDGVRRDGVRAAPLTLVAAGLRSLIGARGKLQCPSLIIARVRSRVISPHARCNIGAVCGRCGAGAGVDLHGTERRLQN